MLDLWQGASTQHTFDPATESPDLPATFGEGFDAAWNEGRLFTQSIAGENARWDALQDHIDDLNRRTGKDINQQIDLSGFDVPGVGFVPPSAHDVLPQVNAAAQKLGQPELSPDDLEQRAVEKSRAAETAYGAMAAREKAPGGGLGMFLGGAAAHAADPINLVTLPVAPEAESVSVLAAALRWGAVGGLAQAGIEAAGAPYHEEVQPGYLESGAPLENIMSAAGQGALLGGATRFLGNAWTRVKTGAWPTSIRDAGNVVESEANIQGSNVYRDADGDVAHRQALGSAIDAVLSNKPVNVSDIITPDIEAASRNIMTRLEAEHPMMPRDQAMPIVDDAIAQAARRPIVETPMPSGANSSKDLNGPVYVDPRVPEPLRLPVAVHETVEQVMMNRGLPYEQAHIIATQAEKRIVESLGMNWEQYTHQWDGLLSGIEHEKVSNLPSDLHVNPAAAIGHHGSAAKQVSVPITQARALAAHSIEEARTVGEAASHEQIQLRLPFEATAAVARMRQANEVLAGGVQQIARRAGYDMADEEAARVADRLVKATPEEADDILRELQVSPRQVAQAPESRGVLANIDQPITEPPERLTASPDFQNAIRGDIDRERATGDVQIPVDVDKDGNPVMRGVDAAMNEVDALKTAAEEIQACAAGPAEPEAEAA
jgi:hypothetical protein